MNTKIQGNKLRVICFGMGAIGTYIGGSLASVGAEVVFIERKESLLKTPVDEIRLSYKNQEIVIPKPVILSDLRDVLKTQPFDVAILAVKSFDTQSVLESINGFEDQFPPILCLQNGVENEDLIAGKLGGTKVIAGTVTSAITRSNLGKVRLEKLRGVGIECGHKMSIPLIEWFNRAGLHAKGFDSRADMKWSKMLTNLLANASSAILNWSPKQIFSNPLTYHIEVAQIREALAVMRAMDIHVVDLPGTPVNALMRIFNFFPESFTRKLIGVPLAKARGAKMPSFHIDLYAGGPLSEVTFLNGAVSRFGKMFGVNTPVNLVLTETLEALTSGTLKFEQINDKPEKLMKMVEEVK
jgi:2-dehydropantoate 2-reductase